MKVHAPVKGGRSSDGGILVGCSHIWEFRLKKCCFKIRCNLWWHVVQLYRWHVCQSLRVLCSLNNPQKNNKWCADDPGAFFLAGMNGLLHLGSFCCRDYVMNPSCMFVWIRLLSTFIHAYWRSSATFFLWLETQKFCDSVSRIYYVICIRVAFGIWCLGLLE